MATPLQNVPVYICARVVFSRKGFARICIEAAAKFVMSYKKLRFPYLVNFLKNVPRIQCSVYINFHSEAWFNIY